MSDELPDEVIEAIKAIKAHEEEKKQMTHYAGCTVDILGYKRTMNWDEVNCPSCLRGRTEVT
jgi:glycyl-tRNA synthetase (class II)